VMMLSALAISHILAAVVGWFLLKRTLRRVVWVVSLALIPAILFSLQQAYDAVHLRYNAIYDRFRDNLVAPIPASVSDLKFFSLEEQHDTHLIFRFTISPEDLDQIIKSKGFVQIDRTQFRRRDDLFTHVEYLPVTEPANNGSPREMWVGTVEVIKTYKGNPGKQVGIETPMRRIDGNYHFGTGSYHLIYGSGSEPYYMDDFGRSMPGWAASVPVDGKEEFKELETLTATHGATVQEPAAVR